MTTAIVFALSMAFFALGWALHNKHRFETSVRVAIRKQQLAHERLVRRVEGIRLGPHAELDTVPLEPSAVPFKLEHRDWGDSRVATRKLGAAETFPQFFMPRKRNG